MPGPQKDAMLAQIRQHQVNITTKQKQLNDIKENEAKNEIEKARLNSVKNYNPKASHVLTENTNTTYNPGEYYKQKDLEAQKRIKDLKPTTIEEKAAHRAGLATTASGTPRINSAEDWKAYDKAVKEIQAEKSNEDNNTLDDRYINLQSRVKNVNLEQYKKDFVLQVFPICLECEDKTGIPAEITFGQVCSESGYGSKTIIDKYTGKQANNYFGIKGSGSAGTVTSDTYEYINGKKISIEANFKAYNSPTESFEDHARLLLNNYKKYTTEGTPKDWAKALEKGGYSTTKNYGDEILSVSKYWGVYEND